jgi:stearoyl-CoA desaturase (delta-9 desaturase)
VRIPTETALAEAVNPDVALAPRDEADIRRDLGREGTRRLPLPAKVDTRRINWEYAIPVAVIHLLALLVLVPWLFSWAGVVVMFIGVSVFGQLGIPVCYHRQLTHRSFRTPKWLERSFVMMALCSAQETPAKWVAWHRMHHNYSDEQEDPHSPLVNFLWSHFGWLVYYNATTTNFSAYQKYARDILEDPFYMFLEKHRTAMGWIYLAHAVIFFAVSLVAGWLIYGYEMAALQLALSLVVWGVIARTVWVWHITWAVNSLSHMFGYRNYETTDQSRNNWFVAALTGGEGWHNNHHEDQASASVQHNWWEVDSNYYIIKTLEFLGLATHVIPPRRKRQATRQTVT